MTYPKCIYIRLSSGTEYSWFGASNETTTANNIYQLINFSEDQLPEPIKAATKQAIFNNSLASPLAQRTDMFILERGCFLCAPPKAKRLGRAPFAPDDIQHGAVLAWDATIDPPTPKCC
jgi:hypothetical protein